MTVPSPAADGPTTARSPLVPEEVELIRVRLQLRRPQVAAHGTTTSSREVVVVSVRFGDGATGWGECPTFARPSYSPEYTDGAWALLTAELVPALLAGRPARVVGHPMARAALADAVFDAQLRREGRSVAEALGGTRARVPGTTVISGPDPASVHAQVAATPGPVKVKLHDGFGVGDLAELRADIADRWLAADANGGLPARNHEVAAHLDALGLAYLEQPVAGLAGAAAYGRAIDTPVAVDEPVDGADAIALAAELAGISVVNLKPARLGGVVTAAGAAQRLAAAGRRVLIGGMLESGVGRALALGVASLDCCDLPTDLGPSDRYFDDDLTAPVGGIEGHEADPMIVVPEGPGSGVAIRPERLEAVAVDRHRFSR